jgi:hypothetical protein
MAVRTANLEDLLKEGEYETQFGKIIIDKTNEGFRIVFYINAKELGHNMAKQIALSLVAPHLNKREQLV